MSFAHVVLVGTGVAHLDQAYTYRVPDGMPAHVGAVVRVPVRGKSREGVVVDLFDTADVSRAQPIRAMLGPGLTEEIVALCRNVAAHSLSSLGEALGAAIPPRVAEVEGLARTWPSTDTPKPSRLILADYKNGDALIEAVRGGGSGAYSWRPLSREPRGETIAGLVREAVDAGRGALVLLPEIRASSSVAIELEKMFGGAIALLGSDRTQRERYRAWLALRRGDARIAVGGRAAVFAPVPDLGLIVVDDEAHISYKERRSPRYNTRPVAFGRARAAGAVFVAVGAPPSMEAFDAVERGALTAVAPTRATEVRARPAVVVVDRTKGEDRLSPSSRAIAALRNTLHDGKRAVLLVHRSGDEARAIAARAIRVLEPKDPARLDARSLAKDPDAFGRALRGSDFIVASPVIAKDIELEGIGCVAVTEADAALASPEFRAAEEAFATWWRAGRWLGRDASIVIDTSFPRHAAIAALVRWDPAALWRAERPRRLELGYPPFTLLVRIDVSVDQANEVLRDLRSGFPAAEILGPADHGERVLVVVRSRDRAALLHALQPIAVKWRAQGTGIRIDVDPRDVLR